MREGWREVRLGDVATRRTDFSAVLADKLYRIVGVQRSGWGLVDREPARGDSMKFDKLMELHADDLVYRTITAFEAPSTVVLPEFEGAFVTPQTFPVYTIDRSQLLPGYMALLTTSPAFHEEMSTRCVGTVLRRKTLSKSAFESISVELPPLAEQRRIVELIAAVDDAIEAAENEARTYVQVLSALLTRELSFNEAGTTAVIDLIEFMLGGAWGSRPGADEVDVTALGPSAYKGGVIAVDPKVGTLRSLSEKRAADRSLREGDIVLERSGGSPSQPVGRVIRMEKSTDAVVPSDFMRLLRVDRSKAEPAYVFWTLWCAYRTGRSTPFQKRTTSIFNLNIPTYLAGLKVNVPTLDEQREVVALAEAAWSTYNTARTHADSLLSLRSNLLTVLLSGKHEIPESYDHRLDLAEEGAAA